jgi:hypothetical protein
MSGLSTDEVNKQTILVNTADFYHGKAGFKLV